ncbi:septum formation family protein [Candidatus Poriferisocius sp.]|uniref:septum formation family protein n=1 Tax=Candidatus Poriferisocius sp. TaxID=3101276 RepID=UPI003B023CEC
MSIIARILPAALALKRWPIPRPRIGPATRILPAAALVMALVWSGCTTAEPENDRFSEVFVDPTPEPDLLPTEEDLRDRFEGTVTEPYDLLVGTCFNQYSYRDRNDLLARLTTAIGCTRPHNAQVYAMVLHDAPPGAPYPGEEAVDTWGQMQCYQKFESFVGLAYELSQLEIGMITPRRDTWEGEDSHRLIACYVYSLERKLLVGTMNGIAL